ncbi:carbohydrate ABC transporter permease [Breznakiella homolactica]|uniref:Carbohydrate ABC transporter permease n=1 Tax=Breznakiella homolactica TaxID=2798577 RepID=A0A7T7XLI8_9SPIR|nr:carbohydrate ABC transporter permease [Breznakiella homolactica]QQO08624.1 carbohydrate ABC transporter permease [Breznakiella homolactica]
MTKSQRYTIKSIGVHTLAILALIPVLFPIYWLIVSALQDPQSIISIPPRLFPKGFSLYFVRKVFGEFGIGRFLFNSVFLSVTSTFLTLVVACLAAFSYIAYKFRFRETFSKLVLFVYMFPQILIIIPIYLLMTRMHLINTFTGLMLCYIAFELPICIWTMQSYFETIPRDLVDAAEIDGLSRIRTLWHVFLPVALPGLAASGIMTFIGIWNNFLLANTLLIDETKKTLPVVIADFASRDNMMQGDVLAASLVVCIPSFFFALFAQKYLVGGLTSGAVKA